MLGTKEKDTSVEGRAVKTEEYQGFEYRSCDTGNEEPKNASETQRDAEDPERESRRAQTVRLKESRPVGAEGKDRKYGQRREGRLCRLRANIIIGDCCRPNKGKLSPTARKSWGERLKNERAKKWIARVRTDTSLGESSRKTQGRSWRTVGGISRGCSWGGWSGS